MLITMVEHPLMVRWVIGLIPHGGPIELFLVPASAPKLVNKGRGMYYPAYDMVHMKDFLLLITKSSPYGSSRLKFSLPYTQRHIAIIKKILSVSLNKTFHSFILINIKCY